MTMIVNDKQMENYQVGNNDNEKQKKKSTSTKLARLASTSFECIRINNNLQYSMIKLIRDGETDGLK